MIEGFALHINSTYKDFQALVKKIVQENHNSLKGIDEIKVVLYDDKDLDSNLLNMLGGGKLKELGSFDIGEGPKFVFVGRPELGEFVQKFKLENYNEIFLSRKKERTFLYWLLGSKQINLGN